MIRDFNFVWKRLLLSLLLLLLVTAYAQADDNEKQKRLADKAELAFVQTGGNTDVTTLAAKNELKYQFAQRWSSIWKAALLYGQTDGVKSAERYETNLRFDFNYSEIVDLYTRLAWYQDKFAGIDQRYAVGPGVGHKFLRGPRHFFVFELGANYAIELYTDETKSDFLEGRAFVRYEFILNDMLKCSQEVEYLHNFKDAQKYRAISVTAFETKINDHFSIKTAYNVNYDHQPTPDTLKTTDTLLSVSLVLNI